MFSNLHLHIQTFARKMVFYINKTVFSLVQKYDQKKYTFSFSKSIYQTLFFHLLLNSVCAYWLFKGDQLLYPRFPQHTLNHDIFLNVTIGGLGIAGVILGLYCSNMAAIYSSKYTNAPNTLSQTFQRDIITNKCLGQIIGYIILSLIMILECMLNIPVYYVSTIFYLFLTMRMIITFSVAGNRSYYFSDTFRIAGNLYPEIMRMIRRVSNQKYWAKDINFQNHFQKLCDRQLKIMTDIAEYNKRNPQNQNPAMLDFMKNNLFLLEYYWTTKPGIYYHSYWWANQADYPQWHRASDTEISIALQTGTTLMAKQKRNLCWFEESIEKINGFCFDKLCVEKDLASVYSYLTIVSDISVSALDQTTLRHWISYVSSLHQKVLPLLTVNSKTEETSQLSAGIADIISLNYISLLVGINKYLQSLDTDTLDSHVTSKRTFHELDFSRYPFLNQDFIENMYQHIETEVSIEGARITPDWYIVQTTSQALYQYLNMLVEAMLQMHTDIFSVGKQLLKDKSHFPAALIFSRFPEIDSKSSIAINQLEQILAVLKEKHIEKSIIWNDSPLEALKKEKYKTRKQIPQHLITCSKHFAFSHWSKRSDYPDLLGQCYNYLCEYILCSIEEDDFDLFQASYKDFLGVMLLYQEYIRSDIINIKEQHRQRIVFHVFAAPIIEFAMLCGFAIIWGEFSKNTNWKTFIDAELDSFIQKNPSEAATILEQIVEITTEAKRPLLGIGNRDILHTGWEQRISRFIKQSDYFQVIHRPYLSKEIVTESKIIKTFCCSFEHNMLSDSEDIYLLLCVNPHLREDKKFKSHYQWEEEHETIQ